MTGEIHDTWDQKPIPGVTVEILGSSVAIATTDARGAFAIGGVAKGQHKVRLTAEGESFVLDGPRIDHATASVWRIGLPTRSSIVALQKAMAEGGIVAAKVKGWSDLPLQAQVSPDVATVGQGWHALVEQCRQASRSAAQSNSLKPFASVVPGGSRMAALLAAMLARGDLGSRGASEMPAPGPGQLLAEMLHIMDVVAMRPSTDYPFGVDVFLADDRLAPPPDLKNLTRKNTPSVLVTLAEGHLAISAVSPALADALDAAWKSALLTGTPWRRRTATEGPEPTLFEQMTKLRSFDDRICLRCEDLLTMAIIAKHLPGSTSIAGEKEAQACHLECKTTLGSDTIGLTADCGLKNEKARDYDKPGRRLKDEPLIETSEGMGGGEFSVTARVSDNDTPCFFSIRRSGRDADADRKKKVLALAQDIAAVATPDLLASKTYEAVMVGEDDNGALAESWRAKLAGYRPAIEALLPFPAGFPTMVDGRTQSGLPANRKALLLARCGNGQGEDLRELLRPLVPDIELRRVPYDKAQLACPRPVPGWEVSKMEQDALPHAGELRMRVSQILNTAYLANNEEDTEPEPGKPHPGGLGKTWVYLLDKDNNLLDWKQVEFASPAAPSSQGTSVDDAGGPGTCSQSTRLARNELILELHCSFHPNEFCSERTTETITHTVGIQDRKLVVKRKTDSTAPRGCDALEGFGKVGAAASPPKLRRPPARAGRSATPPNR